MTTQNLENETIWHESNPWFRPKHLLNKWPFVHPARATRAYGRAKGEVRAALLRNRESNGLAHRNGVWFERALSAPCGRRADLDVLAGLAREFHGIDVRAKAVEQCPSQVITKVGDILDSGYEAGYFDLVASILFFHHLHKVGFDPFLEEFGRVLRPGGVMVVLEPSAYYAFGWLTWVGKRMFGNVTGQVPDEGPLVPSKLTRAMKRAGFAVETFRCASFSHNRLPVPVQWVIDLLTAPLRGLGPFRHMGWMCLWICRKK